ncbi:helix-turn-helix transcriptional regulator [Pseudokineococcus basanitobsidens]|uniref:Helix-turn-helix transcriptional regulator n=1 Tax=Pseudokineococcus basanitobsidens TaxID=1926649 RepID=A0ABU8RFK5_9ACTN
MAVKTTPARVQRAGQDIGAQLAAWRKLQDLTAQQVAERAGISRDTLRRLEHGEVGVSLETVLGVARALGALDRLVEALDPWQTDLGRARAGASLPQRVRR